MSGECPHDGARSDPGIAHPPRRVVRDWMEVGKPQRVHRVEPLREPALFGQVRVDEELGTIVWPNGADLDPDVLHNQNSRDSAR